MAITVRALMDDVGPQVDLVVEADLDRDVRWVLTTDLQDPAPYLRGGEVVLTNGLWRELGTTSEEFVRQLLGADVPALGYGLGSDRVLPEEVIEACRAAQLTLFSVPYEMPFVHICQAFVGRLQSEEQRAMEAAVELSSQYLSASTEKDSILAILDVLSRSRSLSVQLLGPGPKARANPRDRISDEETLALWRDIAAHAGASAFELGGRSVFPIRLPDRAPAYLLVASGLDGLSTDARLAIEQALVFIRRELEYECRLMDSEQRFTDELVDLALAGAHQDHAVRVRLQALELDPTRPLRAIVACNVDSDASLTLLGEHLRRRGLACALARRGESSVVIAQWEEEDTEQALATAVLPELPPRIVLGFGAVAKGSPSLRASIITAEQAAKYAAARHPAGGFASHSQLGSHEVLLALQDEDIVRGFCEGLLGPLRSYDDAHQSELLSTLEQFLSSGCRWRETADQLCIHVNTLRHRIRRIEGLTGRDLSSMPDRVDFTVALTASATTARS
jgi:purine catabolism regulator